MLSIIIAVQARADAVFTGRVVHVASGDSLTVETSSQRIRIRLAGIDAPEVGQPYGSAAKKVLARLVFDRWVRVRVTDRTASSMCAQISINGVSVEEFLVRRGLAWVMPDSPSNRHLSLIEHRSRMAERGMWANYGNISPWRWRAGSRISAGF